MKIKHVKSYFLLFSLLTLLLVLTETSCTKYRDVPTKYGSFVAPPAGIIQFGSLRINEFVCKGSNSSLAPLGGATCKWFELYNPTTGDITLTAGQWFVTDTVGVRNKYAIPTNTAGAQWVVPSKGFLIIGCPKSTTTPIPGKINTNFSLSSTISDIGIYYQATPSSGIIAIDSIHYNFGTAGALSSISYGRLPDGQNPATLKLSTPTPEAPNQ